MKYLILSTLLLSAMSNAEVNWDIPVEKFGDVTGKLYLFNLTVGDTAKIDEYSIFCTDESGNLAVNGLTEIGSGDYVVKLLPGNKLELTVPNGPEFVSELITGDSFAKCSWWTADKGESAIQIDSVNGHKSLSKLAESKP